MTVTYDQALETALCFGWIDAQVKTHDDKTFVRKFTPRRVRSVWSKVNRAKAEALIKSGKMRPAGLSQIEAARADGRWDTAYDSAKTATVPADLQAALDKSAQAAAFFTTLDRTNRYSVLWRVQTARTPALRAKRISELVAMLKSKKVFHPKLLK